jgi:hypothetical protein
MIPIERMKLREEWKEDTKRWIRGNIRWQFIDFVKTK